MNWWVPGSSGMIFVQLVRMRFVRDYCELCAVYKIQNVVHGFAGWSGLQGD